MNVAERFAANLIRARGRVGLSQEALGFRASLHRTEVSQLERGLRIPRIDTVVKLAGSLEVKADELLEGIDWHPGEMRPGSFKAPDAGATL